MSKASHTVRLACSNAHRVPRFTKEIVSSVHLATQASAEHASLPRSHVASLHLLSNEHAAGSQQVSADRIDHVGNLRIEPFVGTVVVSVGREFSTRITKPKSGLRIQGL